jgi:hypothetical protein
LTAPVVAVMLCAAAGSTEATITIQSARHFMMV